VFFLQLIEEVKGLMENQKHQTGVGEHKTVSDFWQPKTVEPAGCGSDDCGIIHHGGVATLDISFSFSNNEYEAVYHSNYDSYYWMHKFGDPSFQFHAALCKVFGSFAIEMADQLVIPLNLTEYALALHSFVESLASTTTEVDFNALFTSAASFTEATQALIDEISTLGMNPPDLKLRWVNDRLSMTEKSFLTFDPALVGRKWFRHVLYTPSIVDQYEGQTFAAIRDAIAVRNFTHAQYLVKRTSQVLQSAANNLRTQPWAADLK